MKISQDVKNYSEEQKREQEQQALDGMAEKSREFRKQGSEIYIEVES